MLFLKGHAFWSRKQTLDAGTINHWQRGKVKQWLPAWLWCTNPAAAMGQEIASIDGDTGWWNKPQPSGKVMAMLLPTAVKTLGRANTGMPKPKCNLP